MQKYKMFEQVFQDNISPDSDTVS